MAKKFALGPFPAGTKFADNDGCLLTRSGGNCFVWSSDGPRRYNLADFFSKAPLISEAEFRRRFAALQAES